MLSRSQIMAAFSRLSDELGKSSLTGEIAVVDGTAMVLAFGARQATKDVDAVFEPSAIIRQAAATVALELELPLDWLNDAAKGFLSATGEFVAVDSLDFPNLRVVAPTAEYMLALKVMAARTGRSYSAGDAGDIAFLIHRLGLETSEAVMAIVSKYYDPTRILPRSLFLVDQIIEDLKNESEAFFFGGDR